MEEVLTIAEALWTGKTDVYAHHPFGPPYGPALIADGLWFVKGFANTIVLQTPAGLVIVDPGGFVDFRKKYDTVRKFAGAPLHTAIYTHGHIDHVFGVSLFAAEDAPRPNVIAHERLPRRLQRYARTAGWNSAINGRQFRGGAGNVPWPDQFDYPTITHGGKMDITVGGHQIQLRHTCGETDDHTWVYLPDQRVLCTGDLFIWAIPNAGNPQKVQRYAAQWAVGLAEMAALAPEVLLPGHGFPIVGARRVREALLNTAQLLEHLDTRTVALMNHGASLDRILEQVRVPEHLAGLPYLQPIYDEPEFIVRNIYRLYGGWYDGMPSHLKPAPEAAQAREIASLCGGAATLAGRAEQLVAEGDCRLACHLADWAVLADPGDPLVRAAAGRVYAARMRIEPSTMALGIFASTARAHGARMGPGEMAKGHLISAQAGREGLKKPSA